MQDKKRPKGRFTRRDLKVFWPEPEFKICYQLRSSRTYLVPRMMDKMPENSFCPKEEHPLHLYYEYTFMPEGLLNRLSVRLHEMIGGEKGDRVWSDGVVFQEKDLTALPQSCENFVHRMQKAA